MPLKSDQIEILLELLGREGALAGLEHSKWTNDQLLELAQSMSLAVNSKTRRSEIADEIVNSSFALLKLPQEEMLGMSPAALKEYFEAIRVSQKELISLLRNLGIRTSSESRKSLREFAAREISEIGMYQRVARGQRNAS